MGFGTVFTMLAFLMVFAGMITLLITVQTTISESSTQIKQQQRANLQAQKQEITITTSSYQQATQVLWKTEFKDEWDEGNYTNTTTKNDALQLTSTKSQGTYKSRIYDTGFSSNFTTISFNALIPQNTNITFQIKTANDTATLQSLDFIGPDATKNTYYNYTGQTINNTHDNSSLIQYIAYINSNQTDNTPILYDVQIGVVRSVGHVILTVDNTGSEKLKFEETDVYIDGLRISRNQAKRVFSDERILDTRLWNKGESLNITVFTNITAGTAITITNNYAKDVTVVNP